MLLHQFHSRFPTEDTCIEYFKTVRMQQGVSCPECKAITHKWLSDRKVFQCPQCGCSIPLTKGTVMEHSKLSLSSWFYTMHLMTSVKQVLSAKEVQHQLDSSRYTPIWLMMMKLRNIMGKRDAIYELSGEVELDEAFFPIRVPEEAQGDTFRRGAGSQRQAKVLVIVESKSADEVLLSYLKSQDKGDKIGKIASKMKGKSIKKVVHYIKMFVLDNLKANTIDKIVREHVAKDAVVITDNSSSYVNLSEYFSKHESFTEKGNVDEVVKSVLPWVHIVIGRCRDGIAVIHGDADVQFCNCT